MFHEDALFPLRSEYVITDGPSQRDDDVDSRCNNKGAYAMTNTVTERRVTTPSTEPASHEKVHELRNRLYASSLAFRAICTMLDKGNTQAARAAAETMLAKLNNELEDSRDCDLSETSTELQGYGVRVLVVEDDDMEAQLLWSYLTEKGYEVNLARDGIDALTRLKSNALPDIVLLDMNMPRLDGSKTITSIRSDERLRDLTLIAISGTEATNDNMRKARRNVDFWITKPADPERIIGAIQELACR